MYRKTPPNRPIPIQILKDHAETTSSNLSSSSPSPSSSPHTYVHPVSREKHTNPSIIHPSSFESVKYTRRQKTENRSPTLCFQCCRENMKKKRRMTTNLKRPSKPKGEAATIQSTIVDPMNPSIINHSVFRQPFSRDNGRRKTRDLLL